MNRNPAVNLLEVPGIDLDYRPASYFLALDKNVLLPSGISGEARRKLFRARIEAGVTTRRHNARYPSAATRISRSKEAAIRFCYVALEPCWRSPPGPATSGPPLPFPIGVDPRGAGRDATRRFKPRTIGRRPPP
jgi:hypothetical protein